MRRTGTPVVRNTFGVPRLVHRFGGKGITTGSDDAVTQAAISCSIEIAPACSVIVLWLMDRGPSGVCNGTYTSMRELVRPNAFSVACRCTAMAANS